VLQDLIHALVDFFSGILGPRAALLNSRVVWISLLSLLVVLFVLALWRTS
jgi:hypothetical protein